MKQQYLFEIIGLRSARGRVCFFIIASVLIFLVPVSLLAHLSIWNHLGLPAPSIGLTRAYHYVLHGDIRAALTRNALIVVVLAIGLPLIIRDAVATIQSIMHKNKRRT